MWKPDLSSLETEQKVRLPRENLLREISQKYRRMFLDRPPSEGPETFLKPGWMRISLPVATLEPLGWLSQQSQEEKIYWANRDRSIEVAGIGKAAHYQGDSFEELPVILGTIQQQLAQADSDIRYFGGLRFNPHSTIGELWQPFRAFQFRVPEVELVRKKGTTVFALNLWISSGETHHAVQKRIMRAVEKLRWEEGAIPPLNAGYLSREDEPSRKLWKKSIEHALQLFASGRLQKIVLARHSRFCFRELLSPLQILHCLKSIASPAFHFVFQLTEHLAFIGASPERLYFREGQNIFTEAVAGTRPRGETPEEDRRLESDLMNSAKDLREHRWVVESIKDVLQEICSDFSKQQVRVLKLNRLQHLMLPLWGTLKPGVSDATILNKLHPTPAVGGVPTREALKEIDQIEPFDRGWYAGPVGWINRNGAEFAVAIRSGLVREKELHLFSGAGIVEGSRAGDEWAEIENKIGNYMRIFEKR